jgi:TetR/AcrR family transcriptional repressor of nem operon
MARPREFDENAVLDAAAQRFWIYGYEATSVRDLAQGMGITGASLYNAFGDKRSLFQRALARYVETSFGDRVSRFERSLPPLDAIKAFFRWSGRSATGTVRDACW